MDNTTMWTNSQEPSSFVAGFVMPASGGSASGCAPLAHAGADFGIAAYGKRRAITATVATGSTPGTQVWSPPT